MNTEVMLRVENLGKMYHIGKKENVHSTLAGKIFKSITMPIRRLTDPRLARTGSDAVEDLWALRNVSFELKKGEVLGVIGRNGSGKSTLLKIISRITAPTEGKIEISGPVGSLLEVGIGFHPDLTGRENIYLSGAIQGFKRSEMDELFDEIVAFSEIEPFIDTPVKRYSSGMYVRLAFSVAAHFRHDILILDEVLAVGDVLFQKKCLEKMEAIAKSGKTVLFVSHAMPSITRLCDRGLYLDKGKMVFLGTATDTVSEFLKDYYKIDETKMSNDDLSAFADVSSDEKHLEGHKIKIIRWVSTHDADGNLNANYHTGDTMQIRIGYQLATDMKVNCQINFLDYTGSRAMQLHNTHCGDPLILSNEGYLECNITDIRLLNGKYTINVIFYDAQTNEWIDSISGSVYLNIQLGEYLQGIGLSMGQVAFAQKSTWKAYQ